ncbi:MAG TPA: DUF3592 domain-containing protein [Actinomycetota bacterium]|nr:DUF3592 domain-containing protein [Actinomycetota bacterium]
MTADPRTGRRTWASSLASTRPRPVVVPPPSETEPAPASETEPAPAAAPAPGPVAAGQEPVGAALEPEPGAEPEHDQPDPPGTPPPAARPPSPPAPPSARPSGKRTDGSRPAPAPSRRRKVALGALLVLIGLLVLPVAGMLLIHVSNVQRQFSQLRADGVHAEGTLLNGGSGSRDQITFTDQSGRVITRIMPAPNGNDVLPDGKVDVIYVPVNPGNASLAHLVAQSDHVDAALLVGSGLGAVAGLALIFWGVVLLTGSRSPMADAPEAGPARATSPA